MDTDTQKAIRGNNLATLGEQNRVEQKMMEIVQRWQGKPEPAEKSREWFQRKGDRIVYRILREKLKRLTGGQGSLLTMEQQIAYSKEIGLIE